ncbi:phosphatase PAP2 family protein [Pseudodesulfovibrio piezophilus]|nr:phosphatase PAP2 family protein [Pseudodesulfovibrio piezophilus]
MRNDLLKHWCIFSSPLLLMLLALWIGIGPEANIAVFFHDHRATHPLLKGILTFVTDWSNPAFYVLYAGMLMRAFRSNNTEKKRYLCILFSVQFVVSALCVHFIKFTVGRPRPGQGTYFEPMTARGSYHSLPSGHTSEITGWALPLAFRQKRHWLTCFLALFIGLVGFSRVYLGWHHPSDVFFGWLLGSFVGFATSVITASSLFKGKAA